MNRYSLLALFLTVIFNNIVQAEDGLTCGRERPPTFRQLCSVKAGEYALTNTLNFDVSYGSVSFPTRSLVTSAVLKIKNSDDTEDSVILSGLIPELRVVTNLTNLPNCKLAGLWKNRLVLQVKSNDDKDVLQSNIPYGPYDHLLTLARYNETSIDHSFFTYKDLSQKSVEVSTRFILKNLDSTEVSIERIPSECALNLEGRVIGYNATLVRSDLKWLKTTAKAKDRELIKNYILNGFYIDKQRGAVCSVRKLADTLKKVEVLPETEPYTSLSPMSQSAVSDSIQNALDVGGIPKSRIDFNDPDGKWKFFVSTDGQKFFTDTCKDAPEDYDVDRNKFVDKGKVTNAAAYQNAIDFERERGNLLQVLAAVWALVGAASADVTKSDDLQWIIDSSLYSHFN